MARSRATQHSRLSTWFVSQRCWVRYPVWLHTFVPPSADSRGAVVSYWRKYVHEVLVNRLGGLSLPRKRVVWLTDRPDMTLDVNRGRKTTTQQQQQWHEVKVTIEGHEFELLILCPPHRTHVSVMLAQCQGCSLDFISSLEGYSV